MKLVPRAGVEPARVAPLVFDTSASTDSAIWAYASCVLYATSGAKVNVKIILTKISRPYFAGRGREMARGGGETAVGTERAGREERADGCGRGQGAAGGEGLVRKVGRERDVS